MGYRSVFGSIIVLTAICTGAQTAEAGLKFCNQGNFKFTVAFGYIDREKGWVAKGWAAIEGGECKNALTTPLDNRYYYFYAVGRGPDQSLVKYSGETAFCVQQTRFVLYQAEYGKSSPEECAKGGLRSEKFMKIDVKGSPDYTVNLGSPPQNAGPGAPPASPPATAAPYPPGPSAAPPPSVATGQPQANQPPAPAPSGGASSPSCQRYPNLC